MVRFNSLLVLSGFVVSQYVSGLHVSTMDQLIQAMAAGPLSAQEDTVIVVTADIVISGLPPTSLPVPLAAQGTVVSVVGVGGSSVPPLLDLSGSAHHPVFQVMQGVMQLHHTNSRKPNQTNLHSTFLYIYTAWKLYHCSRPCISPSYVLWTPILA